MAIERYALVNNGLVENVIVVDENTGNEFFTSIDPEFDAVVNVTGHTVQPSPGWNYDGTTFSPPEE